MSTYSKSRLSLTCLLYVSTALGFLFSSGLYASGLDERPSSLGTAPAAAAAMEVPRAPVYRGDDVLVLAADGGGVRGIIPATFLQWLEDKMVQDIRTAHPAAPPLRTDEPEGGVRISECFSVRAGSSTSGFIILGIGVPDALRRPLYPISKMVELYRERSAVVFPDQAPMAGLIGAKFDAAPLEGVLREYFQDHTLAGLLHPTLVTAYDIHAEGPLLLSSVAATRSPRDDFYLRDAARATSAAPTYLAAARIKSLGGKEVTGLDGGLVANNPAWDAYLLAKELFPARRIHVISLGCGLAPLLTLEALSEAGKLPWAPKIHSLLLSSANEHTHQNMARLAEVAGDLYTRVQLRLDRGIAGLDNATPENMRLLEGRASAEIADLASPLHNVRQALHTFYASRGFYIFFPLVEAARQQLARDGSRLNLSNQHLTARSLWEVVDALTTSEQIAQVEMLDLSQNPLGPASLGYVRDFSGLQTLSLAHTGLGMDGLAQVATFRPRLEHLRQLDWRGNPALIAADPAALWRQVQDYRPRRALPAAGEDRDTAVVVLDEDVLFNLGAYHHRTTGNLDAAVSCHEQGHDHRNRLALAEILMSHEFLRGHADDEAFARFSRGFTICGELALAGDREAKYMRAHLLRKPDGGVLRHLRQIWEIASDDADLAREQEAVARRRALQEATEFYKEVADHEPVDELAGRAAKALANLYYGRDGGAYVVTAQVPIPAGGQKDLRHQLRAARRYYKIAETAGSQSVARDIVAIEAELTGMGIPREQW